MRENYGGRLALKQMKIPPEIVYSLDMNGYEIGEGNFHGDKDVNGEDCDGFERDFHCNASDEDGEIFAGDDDGADDVYRQLAQKEKDLLLAAELGKALLEKNEELSQKYELLQEEYSQAVEVRFCCFLLLDPLLVLHARMNLLRAGCGKFAFDFCHHGILTSEFFSQALEQDKYELKLKVERLQNGSDSRVHELQADLRTLRNELKTLQSDTNNDKQNKRETFAGLTEENEQLHLDLQKVSISLFFT